MVAQVVGTCLRGYGWAGAGCYADSGRGVRLMVLVGKGLGDVHDNEDSG